MRGATGARCVCLSVWRQRPVSVLTFGGPLFVFVAVAGKKVRPAPARAPKCAVVVVDRPKWAGRARQARPLRAPLVAARPSCCTKYSTHRPNCVARWLRLPQISRRTTNNLKPSNRDFWHSIHPQHEAAAHRRALTHTQTRTRLATWPKEATRAQ